MPVTTQTVASGQTSSGLVIQGGNLLNVAAGGTVVATLVGSGGQLADKLAASASIGPPHRQPAVATLIRGAA